MEYKQLRDFDKFLPTAREQKGKVLHSSIDIAIKFKNDPNKENLDVNLDNDDAPNVSNPSIESSQKEKLKVAKNIKQLQDSENSQGEPSSLKKRKPRVKKQQLNLLAKNCKTTSAETVESSKSTEKINCTGPFFGMSSSVGDSSVLSLLTPDMKAADANKIASFLAESITQLRDKPATSKHDERQALFECILKFSEICSRKSDEELKEIVIRRVGSYLTVIYYLLLDIQTDKSELCTKATEAICQLINMIKKKTLSYVN